MSKILSLCMAAVALLLAGPVMAADEPSPLETEFNRVQSQADAGDTSAMACLAHMYWFGVGTRADRSKTPELLQRAIAKGDADARVLAREVDLAKGTPDAAQLRTLESFARKGSTGDQIVLGNYYYTGVGTLLPQDSAKAFYWYGKAAEGGSVAAQTTLASFYAHGWATPRNPRKAAALLAKASQYHESCASVYPLLVQSVIMANMQYPAEVSAGKLRGAVGIRLRFEDDKVASVKVSYPSGYQELDAAALKAVGDSAFPPPPPVYASGQAAIEFYVYLSAQGADPAFEDGFPGQVRSAIYQAVVLPKDLVIRGTRGTAKAVLHFRYLNGQVTGLETATSSGDPQLDAAIIDAVTTAKLPPAPATYRHKRLEFWMLFDYSSQLGLLDADGKPKPDFRSAYIDGEYDAFVVSARKAVADKVVYPVGMRGADSPQGPKVAVEFDYLDGAVSDIVITSQGIDEAFRQSAIQAVQGAVFAPTPPVYAGISMHLRVILNFILDSTPAAAGTTSAAAGAAQHGR